MEKPDDRWLNLMLRMFLNPLVIGEKHRRSGLKGNRQRPRNEVARRKTLARESRRRNRYA